MSSSPVGGAERESVMEGRRQLDRQRQRSYTGIGGGGEGVPNQSSMMSERSSDAEEETVE